MRSRRRIAFGLAAIAILALAACGNDKESEGEGEEGGKSTVNVTVKEWSVAPSVASVKDGSITFNVKNEGPKHEHEFVVVRTLLAANALPTKADGSVDESGQGVESVGEIEEFAVGKTESKTFQLGPGGYVLFCNVVEEEAMPDMGGVKAHYKLGMYAVFSVT